VKYRHVLAPLDISRVTTNRNSIRGRFERGLAGEPIEWPVYAVYDWFVQHRSIDWQRLFSQGLGQINHANLLKIHRPNLKIVETTHPTDRGLRRDVRWITDRGELHEWYLDEWRQEHFIKSPEDYDIVRRALEGSEFVADDGPFLQSEAVLGDGGITVGQLTRTPMMAVQIDLAGLERFSFDIAEEHPSLMELLELMTELLLRQFREAIKTPARYIKLWENLSIDTVGGPRYRRFFVPLYNTILEILRAADKRLLVHYDGKLQQISNDITALDIDGIDSLTPSPEGDMSIAEARACWPDKFLWLHPPLGWHREEPEILSERVSRMLAEAGPSRYCLMISEDVPPNWEQTVPQILRELRPRSL
jgi:hypothetical protein